MAQRLTPIIGLAVAAALALAAVFGLVGLTPAYAGVESPDSRGLSETGFTAQSSQNAADRFIALAAPTGVDSAAGTSPILVDVDGDTAGEQLGQSTNILLPVGGAAEVDLNGLFRDQNDGATNPNITFYKLDVLADGTAVADADLTTSHADTDIVSVVSAGGRDSTDFDADDNPTPTDWRISFPASVDADMRRVTITGGAPGTVVIRAQAEDTDTGDADAYVIFQVMVVAATFVSSSSDPGDESRFDVTFVAPTNLIAGLSEVEIELEDYGFPSSMDRSGIGIASSAVYDSDNAQQPQATSVSAVATNYRAGLQTPDAVSVSGETISITVPDMNGETDRSDDIRAGDLVTVLIRQGAGVTNPTEGGGYPAVITNNEDDSEFTTNEIDIPFLVELDETDGGRGTTVIATGKGFKNGTSLGFFLDLPRQHIVQTGTSDNGKPASNDNGVDDDGDGSTDEADETDSRAQDFVLKGATGGVGDDVYNGELDAGEVKLCDVAQVGGNDVGSCEFTVSNPPFGPGFNYVNALDGRGQKGSRQTHKDQRFELKPSITVTPNGGDPGETILVQGYDFPQGSVSRVQLARQNRAANGTNNPAGLAGAITGNTAVGANGDLNFRLVIPNWAVEGVQDLRVTVGPLDGDNYSDNVNVTIGGPQITVTPTTVLPNQRISLVGTGFTPSSRIAQGTGGLNPSITIGGYVIPIAKINEGDPVSVDNGGKWSASLDLPLRDVTTRDGSREIRVTDSGGRSGTVNVTIPARVVTIDPAVGRIGTTATVRGENFPSKNDAGESFNIEIAYDSGTGRATTVSTTSDASGRFETTIRVPTSATIPSTNTVRVSFDDEVPVPVTTTVTHDVPEGTITLSSSSGVPGSRVTLRGEGFKTFVPVKSVSIGGIDVLPSPAPATDANGMTEFEILVPGLDSGIQTIEVQVSDTTASIGFTVSTGVTPGAETPVADGIANLGDNFLRAFNFNNDTKSWTFYDPDAGDASTMEYFIAGSSYWILIGQTAEVILNRETRNLTCANGNCWNLIVW